MSTVVSRSASAALTTEDVSPCRIGFDVGATKLSSALVDVEGRIRAVRRWEWRATSYQEVLGEISRVHEQLRNSAEAEGIEIVGGVGVALAAILASDRKSVRQAPMLGWRDVAFSTDLITRIGQPVRVYNDANAAAWAEYSKGAGRGERCLLLVTVGTGVGSGIVYDGRLITGGAGLAGEIGHLPLGPDGPPCTCGGRGCLETRASGSALMATAQSLARSDPVGGALLLELAGGSAERITGPLIARAARRGDAVAQRAFGVVGSWLGFGLLKVASVIDPSAIVIGGGLADTGELLLDPTRTMFDRATHARGFRPSVPIRSAVLGNLAGVVGAVLLANEATDAA